jgi:hypothetical protein
MIGGTFIWRLGTICGKSFGSSATANTRFSYFVLVVFLIASYPQLFDFFVGHHRGNFELVFLDVDHVDVFHCVFDRLCPSSL